MNAKSWMWFNALLKRYHGEETQQLLRLLPEEEEELAAQHPVTVQNLSPSTLRRESFLSQVHFSWLLPIFKKLRKAHRELYLRALEGRQRKRLAPQIKLEDPKRSLPEPILTLSRQRLYSKLCPDDLVPRAFLPESLYSQFLEYPRQGLLHLLDTLGLQDLAGEFRFSIDQKSRDAVYRHLDENQREYLHNLVTRESGQKPAKTLLPVLAQDKEKTKKFIHQRGLGTLGQALSGQDKNFLWYFSRRFDTGRAQVLEHHFSKDILPSEEKLEELHNQINEAIAFLQTKSLL